MEQKSGVAIRLSSSAVNKMYAALKAVVNETMDFPPARPISAESYLPKQLVDQAQEAIEEAEKEWNDKPIITNAATEE